MNSPAAQTASYGAAYSQLESAVLELPEEVRSHLTHVLIQSIDEKTSMDADRLSRWADFEEQVNSAVEEGRMTTVDAFEAIDKIRNSLARSSA